MQIRTLFLSWAAPLALVVAAGGCGSGVTVYPVEGKVIYNGKPMKGGGAISLVPLGNQEGKAAGGEIDEDGNYKLTTHSPGDGSMAGEFRVIIIQVTDREPEATEDGQKTAQALQAVAPADRIPMIYADPLNSPLRATVEAKSKNEIDFQLKPQAPVVNQGA
jgi:hypothetical protein